MIDVSSERLISFNQAASFLPVGRRPSAATWWRWSTKGVRGVRLETLLIGGRRMTSREALLRFVAASNADDGGSARSAPPTPIKRAAAIRSAERALANDGI